MITVDIENMGIFSELRMLMALGHQPEVLLYQRGECVGACDNVEATIEGSHLRINRADFTASAAATIDAARIQAPSGSGFDIPMNSEYTLSAEGAAIVTLGCELTAT